MPQFQLFLSLALFCCYPNLLFRDAYPPAKVRKFLGLQAISDPKNYYILLEIVLLA